MKNIGDLRERGVERVEGREVTVKVWVTGRLFIFSLDFLNLMWGSFLQSGSLVQIMGCLIQRLQVRGSLGSCSFFVLLGGFQYMMVLFRFYFFGCFFTWLIVIRIGRGEGEVFKFRVSFKFSCGCQELCWYFERFLYGFQVVLLFGV